MKTHLRIKIIIIVSIQIIFCFHSKIHAVNSTDLISKSEKAVVKIIQNNSNELIGTGFIISEDGYALSCLHVFENSTDLMIQDINGNIFSIDSVYGYSKDEDFILFKIKSDGSTPFEFLELYNLPVEKGDEVLTIGHTAGYPYLATTGIIAGYRDNNTDGSTNVRSSIFFTAPVYYASSGSPLINVKDGKVVGIVSEMTVYYTERVPNINVSIDVTCGFEYLNNSEALSYQDFNSIVLEKDEYSEFLTYLLELFNSNDSVNFGMDYNPYDEFDYETYEENDSEYSTEYFYSYDEDDYFADCRSDLIDQIIYESTLLKYDNKISKAERKIKSAYLLTDDIESIVLQHADLLIFANKLKKAEKILLYNLDIHPDSELLNKKLADVYTLKGNSRLADEYYKKSYDLNSEIWSY